MKILIIEDDFSIASILKKQLEKWDYEVVVAQDFSNLTDFVAKEVPHLILLDITLPSYNGFYWCQEFRKITKAPIIFISSRKESMDIVMAMQFGGDDFIQKPFDLDVVVAKIQALLRRSYTFTNAIEFLSYQDVYLYLKEATLVYHEKTESLTKTELLLMEPLFKAQGQIVKREDLLDACWQGDNFIDDNSLSVNINRLRKKCALLDLDQFIQTKKGIGYYLGDSRNETE